MIRQQALPLPAPIPPAPSVVGLHPQWWDGHRAGRVRVHPSGFVQFREGPGDTWRFAVSGFDHTTSGSAGRCSVIHADGRDRDVPIDARDRLTIAGRKYGRTHWDH